MGQNGDRVIPGPLLHGCCAGQSWPCPPHPLRGYRTTALTGAWVQGQLCALWPNVRLTPSKETVCRYAHMILPQLELEASSLGSRCSGFIKLKQLAVIWGAAAYCTSGEGHASSSPPGQRPLAKSVQWLIRPSSH